MSYAYFRTFHRDDGDTIRNRGTPLAMPVLAVGGKGAPGQVIPDQAQLYAGDVTGAVHPCGRWVAEESRNSCSNSCRRSSASPTSTIRYAVIKL